jgi:hypothetical protein
LEGLRIVAADEAILNKHEEMLIAEVFEEFECVSALKLKSCCGASSRVS